MRESVLVVEDSHVGNGYGWMVEPMNKIISPIQNLPSKKFNIEVRYMQTLADRVKDDSLKPLTTEDVPVQESL